MKTIHIKNYLPIVNGNMINLSDIPKLKELIKELYAHCLKDDKKFHYFFEPEIIIRIDSEEVLNKVKDFLNNKDIQFDEYDYPFAPAGKFGEDPNSIVAKNLELFLTIFHANSIAAITMTEEEHFQYVERLIHTAFNPKLISHQREGSILMNLAKLKLGIITGNH